MSKHYSFVLFLFLFVFPLLGQEDDYHTWLQEELKNRYNIEGGEWVIGQTEVETLNNGFPNGNLSVSQSSIQGMPFTRVLKLQTFETAAQHFRTTYYSPVKKKVKKDDVLLLSLWVRGNEATLGDGFCVQWVNQGRPPYNSTLAEPYVMTKEWTQLYYSMVAQTDLTVDTSNFGIQLGTMPQTCEVGGIALLNFGPNVDIAKLPHSTPHETYLGMEAEASWRAEANNRIEQHRKSDIHLTVMDPEGNPLTDAEVDIQMIRHEFGFGTAVDLFRILGTTPEDRNYQQFIKDISGKGFTFNTALLSYGLNWVDWESGARAGGGPKILKQDLAMALNWLEDNHFKIRGHCLLWDRREYLPEDILQNLDDTAYVKRRVEEHLADILHAEGISDKVVEWDMIQHAVIISVISEILGDEIYAEWYKIARKEAPNAKLFLNESGMLNNAGFEVPNRKQLKELIQLFREQEVEVDALGLNGHFGRWLASPDILYAALEDLASIGIPMSITEFDVLIDDQELAGSYLRDFLTVVFSHPQVNQFILWDIWDGSHFRGNAPLLNEDFSLKPGGEAFIDLVFNEWWTEKKQITNQNGKVYTRGFKGDYEITVTYQGVSQIDTFTLNDDGIDQTISFDFTTSTAANKLAPYSYEVHPNPAATLAFIQFELPQAKTVGLKIVDVLGRTISILQPNQYLGAGSYNYQWSIKNEGLRKPGVYFSQLQIGNERFVRQISIQ